jgi:hypothetical protein
LQATDFVAVFTPTVLEAVDQPLCSAKIAFRNAQCRLEAPKALGEVGLFLAELRVNDPAANRHFSDTHRVRDRPGRS